MFLPAIFRKPCKYITKDLRYPQKSPGILRDFGEGLHTPGLSEPTQLLSVMQKIAQNMKLQGCKRETDENLTRSN
jgi:hypothetical protein